MRSHQRRRTVAALLGLALLSAACGSQVAHDEIVAAAGTAQAVSGRTDTTTSGGPATVAGAGIEGAGTGGPTADAAAGATDPAAGADPAAAASSGGGEGGPAAASGAPVTVGNIGTYSGLLGAMFVGPGPVQAWAQSVNARGGLSGHPVRIITADDGGDPARARSLARQMVEQQGAVAFVGNMMPLSLSGIRPYLEEKGIPLVGGDLSLPDWTESPVIFPSGADVETLGIGAINLLAQAGGTKLAVLYCGESPACGGIVKTFEENTPPGIEIVYTAQVSGVQTDFTSECLQAKDAGADTIYVSSDPSSVSRVGRSCAQQGMHPLYSVGSVAVRPELAADPNLDGLVAPVNTLPWFDTSTPGGADFVRSMQTYASGTPVTPAGSVMYAGGLVLEAAARAAGTDITSASLLVGLRSLRGETAQGLAGPLTFGADAAGRQPCYFAVRIAGGKWTAPNGSAPSCL